MLPLCVLSRCAFLSSYNLKLNQHQEVELILNFFHSQIHSLSFSLFKEFHFPEFTSAVADMKNSVADRNNGQPRYCLLHLE